METEVRPQDKQEEQKEEPQRKPRIDHEEKVDKASDESFPASDPPGY